MDNIKNSNINFGVKLDTAKVLEVTSRKIFQSDGISGIKEIITALSEKPIKATGQRGYKYYAEQYGDKIIKKYPQIADATEKINKITAEDPNIKKAELYKKIQPLINKIGKEIDITI